MDAISIADIDVIKRRIRIMRLIDADAMLKRLEEWNTSDKMDKALYNFTLGRIREQPTVYDVNQVVEQLTNRSVLARPVSWPASHERMREILFRGKRIDNGEWVEGFYYKMSETTYCFKEDYERKPVPEHHYILQERMTDWGLPNQMVQIEVDPETLCEYTGITDKNGNKIWENDICDRKEKYPEVVKMNAGDWTLDYSYLFRSEYGGDYCNLGFYATKRKCVCVIGNIFDNPELLQKGTDKVKV